MGSGSRACGALQRASQQLCFLHAPCSLLSLSQRTFRDVKCAEALSQWHDCGHNIRPPFNGTGLQRSHMTNRLEFKNVLKGCLLTQRNNSTWSVSTGQRGRETLEQNETLESTDQLWTQMVIWPSEQQDTILFSWSLGSAFKVTSLFICRSFFESCRVRVKGQSCYSSFLPSDFNPQLDL